MSTNFYIVNTGDSDRVQEHIGKRSGGWVFGFNGQKQKTVVEWFLRTATLSADEEIQDEMGRTLTLVEFWQAVQATKEPWGVNDMTPQTIRPSGYYDGRNWMDGGFSFSNYEFS